MTSRAEKQPLSYTCFSSLPTYGEKQNSQILWDRTFSRSKSIPPAEPPFFFGTRSALLALELVHQGQHTSSQLQVPAEAEAVTHKSCCVTAAHFHLGFLFALYLWDVYLVCQSTSRTDCSPQNVLTWLQTTETITSLGRGEGGVKSSAPSRLFPASWSLPGGQSWVCLCLGVPPKGNSIIPDLAAHSNLDSQSGSPLNLQSLAWP